MAVGTMDIGHAVHGTLGGGIVVLATSRSLSTLGFGSADRHESHAS